MSANDMSINDMSTNDIYSLLERYLDIISFVETCEWEGFVDRKIISVTNKLILHLLQILTTDQRSDPKFKIKINDICQKGINDIKNLPEKTLKNVKKNKLAVHEERALRKTIVEIQDLLDKIQSINQLINKS
jgi:hypothetical protein